MPSAQASSPRYVCVKPHTLTPTPSAARLLGACLDSSRSLISHISRDQVRVGGGRGGEGGLPQRDAGGHGSIGASVHG